MSEQQPPSGGTDPFAVVILGLAGLGFACCGLTWVSGQLTAALTGQGWQQAAFSHSPAFLAQLLQRRGLDTAWAAAYPQAGDPGPDWLFWTILATLTLTALGLAAWSWTRWFGELRHQRIEPARWATRRQERSIAVHDEP
ncbi:MAG: hypothetical protein ACRDPG_11875, partial [Nocardioidaceae bacterium]